MRFTPRTVLALAVVGLAVGLPGCETPPSVVQVGPGAEITADGLHKVDGVRLGTLWMKPNYRFGGYPHFTLGHTDLTFKRGTRVLPPEQVEEVKARFDEVARVAIRQTGVEEVNTPGPCVAQVDLSLLDLELLDPKDISGVRTTVVSSFGAATLVMDIRDGYTGEPLLRYGRRRPLEGGIATGADPAKGRALTTAFERFAVDFSRDFQRSLAEVQSPEPPMTCQRRAGLHDELPPVGSP